jgi:hypothetical protein
MPPAVCELPLPGGLMPPVDSDMPSADCDIPPTGGITPPANCDIFLAGSLTPLAGNITPPGHCDIFLAGSLTPLAGGNTAPANCDSPPAGGITPLAGGIMPLAGGALFLAGGALFFAGGALFLAGTVLQWGDGILLFAGGKPPPAGAVLQLGCGMSFLPGGKLPLARAVWQSGGGKSPPARGRPQFPSVETRSGSAARPFRRGRSRKRGGALSLGFAHAHAPLPVARRRSARSAPLQGENPFLRELLESPEQRRAVRFAAERRADVVAVEHLGELRQGGPDLLIELPGLPARARGRRRRRRQLGGRRSPLKPRDEGLLPGASRPEEIQGPDLLAVRRLQQLHAGAELLVQPLQVFIVFVPCHTRAGLHHKGPAFSKRGRPAIRESSRSAGESSCRGGPVWPPWEGVPSGQGGHTGPPLQDGRIQRL